MNETKNHRTNNWKHAKREKRIYYQLLKENNADTKRIEDLEHFNFKKTNALKKKYSCGGYGGFCTWCRRMEHKGGKIQRKMVIDTGTKEINLCLRTKFI